jgi:Protein of unknown function (DUF2490)
MMDLRPLSRRVRWLFPALLLLAWTAAPPLPAEAQQRPQYPGEDSQIWLEWQGDHPLGSRRSLLIDGGLHGSNGAGHLIYRRVGAGISFRRWKFLTLAPSYHFYQVDSSPARESRENRLTLAATAALPIGRWTLGNRDRIERRFLAGGNSWRFRNRLEVMRGVTWRRAKLEVFARDEVFYETKVHAWTRNRAMLGAEKTLSPRLSLGLYFVRQDDGYVRPGSLNGLGITLHTRI